MTLITKLNNTQKQYIIYKNIAIESHKQYYIYLLILYYILFVYVVISNNFIKELYGYNIKNFLIFIIFIVLPFIINRMSRWLFEKIYIRFNALPILSPVKEIKKDTHTYT